MGECAFCGHPDHRHRVWDAIFDRFCGGESLASLATDYRKTPAEIEELIRHACYEASDAEWTDMADAWPPPGETVEVIDSGEVSTQEGGHLSQDMQPTHWRRIKPKQTPEDT